jgi:hypothetical protein
MTRQTDTCLPAAVWFLFSEQGEPLGQTYRGRGHAVPAVGEPLADGDGWAGGVVVGFTELAATCAMRRFRVVVRAAA